MTAVINPAPVQIEITVAVRDLSQMLAELKTHGSGPVALIVPPGGDVRLVARQHQATRVVSRTPEAYTFSLPVWVHCPPPLDLDQFTEGALPHGSTLVLTHPNALKAQLQWEFLNTVPLEEPDN